MKTLIAAALSVTLIAGSVTPAFADGRDHERREWNHDSRDNRHDNRRDNDRRYDSRRNDDHRDVRRHDDRDFRYGYFEGRRDQRRFDAPRYVAPRGFHARAWHRGDRLPSAYYSSRYIVRDYGSYRLQAPPRGHHWVRVDQDVLLTAIATGAVVAVVSGLFH